jgi:uncharacterized protein YggE
MIKISRTVAATVLVFVGSLGLSGGTASADPGTTRSIAAGRDPQVTVSGEGSHSSTPDVMRLRAGIEVRRPTAGAAFSEARRLAAVLTRVLIEAGIKAKDLQTRELSLGPEHDPYPKVTGYRAVQGVEAVVRNIESADRVVDAVAAVGEDVRLNGVSFEVSDSREALKAARDAAFKDAEARAEQYAGLGGHRLGRIVAINEESVDSSPQTRSFAMAADAGSISPGRRIISVIVKVTFKLK